jgi:hypothetical protein
LEHWHNAIADKARKADWALLLVQRSPQLVDI